MNESGANVPGLAGRAGDRRASGVEPVTRWAHWPRRTESPYYSMFYGAMRAHGVETVSDLELSSHWLRSTPAEAIHVHWPDGLWRQQGKGAFARARGIWRLGRFLQSARTRGVRIIWTVHNLGPHEGGDAIDRRGYRTLARSADLIICHGEWSAAEVRRIYDPAGTLIVMPHGNFEGFHPAARPREETVAALGLEPDRPVVSCLGYLRKYKGLELACAAVARLDDVQLVIAGPRHPKYDLASLRHVVSTVRRAVLIDRRVSDQEFADFTAASDVSLLPYAAVTTSGVLVSSWSLGTPVVASDLPPFRELIPEPGPGGRLFPAGDAAGLADAIVAMLREPRAVRVAAARALSRRYAWSSCVAPVVRWLRQNRGGGPFVSRPISVTLDS